MLYQTDGKTGLEYFHPANLSYHPDYVYAWRDPYLAILFLLDVSEGKGEDEVLLDEENGHAALWERRPGALEKWYSGIGTNLYTLEDKGFLDGLTGWESLSVSTSSVAVTGEERIGDVYEAILRAEKEGLLSVRRYEENEAYADQLRIVSDRIRARKEKPVFVIEDGILKCFDTYGCFDEVAVPQGVVRIGENAFLEAQIYRVTIPEGVKAIEEGAFYGCGLSEVSIPGSVEKIERFAFGSCENLRSVTIPAGVACIEPWAFGYNRDYDFYTAEPNRFTMTIRGQKGSEAERYAKDNEWYHSSHVIRFREIREE